MLSSPGKLPAISAGAKDDKLVCESHLWRIHGNAYDLSPFVDKHPGGQFAILSARGRDCTALFESYHPWNDNNRKVLAMYGPKPPPCDPLYEDMKIGVRKLFPGGPKETKMRTSTFCCLWVWWATLVYLFFVVQTLPACLVAGVLVGLFCTRLSHEGGHFLASSRPWVNRLTLFLGYFPVGPSLCWYYRHVISHHAHTNTESDVDVRHIVILDRLPKWMKWLKVISIPGIFVGAVAEMSVIQLLEFLVLRSVEGDPVCLSVGGLVPEAIVWVAVHSMFGPSLWGYACMWLTAGAVFVPMSQVAHAMIYPEPNLGTKSWATDQICSSVNFAPKSSFWYHCAFGLTTQTDHHLFPGIHACYYDEMHDKVIKPVCAKYNVPVYDVSAKTAFEALWGRLLHGHSMKAKLM